MDDFLRQRMERLLCVQFLNRINNNVTGNDLILFTGIETLLQTFLIKRK